MRAIGRYAPRRAGLRVFTMGDPAAVQFAKDYGLIEDEAQARIERQDEIGALSTDLSIAFRDSFGGLWIDHANEGVA